MYITFLHTRNLSGYMMRIKYDQDLLAVEQNNYLTTIVNLHFVYVLDVWLRNLTNNFKFRNYLSGATNIVKIVIKKSMHIMAIE